MGLLEASRCPAKQVGGLDWLGVLFGGLVVWCAVLSGVPFLLSAVGNQSNAAATSPICRRVLFGLGWTGRQGRILLMGCWGRRRMLLVHTRVTSPSLFLSLPLFFSGQPVDCQNAGRRVPNLPNLPDLSEVIDG